MASRVRAIPGIGEVLFQRRPGSKQLKLRVGSDGKAVVTMPPFTPYVLAERFVRNNQAWIADQQNKVPQLVDGQRVGKVHILRFEYNAAADKPKTRVLASRISVSHAGEATDATVQDAARKACARALRREAERFLPKRLTDLARAHGYSYASCSIKQLKGRWGSCDQSGNIVFNLYLMQLPDELIDYVICHELAHLNHLNHSTSFWNEVSGLVPLLNHRRRQMKQYAPTIPAERPLM